MIKTWLLILVLCSGVERICTPVSELPFEYKTYHMCTKEAYSKSFELLFDGSMSTSIINEKRLFTKWSCLPFSEEVILPKPKPTTET